MFSLTEAPIDAEAVRKAVASTGAGAVVVFHGTVRDETRGRRVLYLEYEAYPAMALRAMESLALDVAREFRLSGIACTHRLGRLDLGEAAVVLAVAAPHRKAALLAVEAYVARMKRDVPIWKKEHFEGGSVWVGSADDPQGERSEPSA